MAICPPASFGASATRSWPLGSGAPSIAIDGAALTMLPHDQYIIEHEIDELIYSDDRLISSPLTHL